MLKRKSSPSPAVETRESQAGWSADQKIHAQWSHDDYAEWFFDFLRTDLAALTPGRQLGMCTDARAFAIPAHAPEADTSGLLDEKGLPTIAALEVVQREARAGIERVRTGDWFETDSPMPWGIRRVGNRIARRYRGGDFRIRFLAAVMDVVQTCWPRLRQCPTCQKVFLKTGKRKYCSTVCANRAHWQAFLRTHGEHRRRDHHGEYARKTRKRLHPKVKPVRRK
jgi:hypothetical protein